MDFRCQACGFRVYNRLYPFCESCKTELAPGIALSAEERAERFATQRKLDEQRRKERSGSSSAGSGHDGFYVSGDLGGDAGCSGTE